jgi:hypothetical protein
MVFTLRVLARFEAPHKLPPANSRRDSLSAGWTFPRETCHRDFCGHGPDICGAVNSL